MTKKNGDQLLQNVRGRFLINIVGKNRFDKFGPADGIHCFLALKIIFFDCLRINFSSFFNIDAALGRYRKALPDALIPEGAKPLP